MLVGFDIKQMFFDTKLVRDATDRTVRDGLSRFGSYAMASDRNSMRYTSSLGLQKKQIEAGERSRLSKVSSSPVGSPPRAVQPHPFIKQFTYFAFDPVAKSVVIGPVAFKNPIVLQLMEKGGTKFQPNPRRVLRKLGGGGEIRAGHGERGKPNADGIMVAYALLKTQKQVDRANRLNEQLYGPPKIQASYGPRPHTAPAFERSLPKLPAAFGA